MSTSGADLLEASPGISSFVSDPAGATPYFAALPRQAARWVPADKAPVTKVRALATAGMRLLSRIVCVRLHRAVPSKDQRRKGLAPEHEKVHQEMQHRRSRK